jgi:hypothetical protein
MDIAVVPVSDADRCGWRLKCDEEANLFNSSSRVRGDLFIDQDVEFQIRHIALKRNPFGHRQILLALEDLDIGEIDGRGPRRRETAPPLPPYVSERRAHRLQAERSFELMPRSNSWKVLLQSLRAFSFGTYSLRSLRSTFCAFHQFIAITESSGCHPEVCCVRAVAHPKCVLCPTFSSAAQFQRSRMSSLRSRATLVRCVHLRLRGIRTMQSPQSPRDLHRSTASIGSIAGEW